MEAAQRTLHDLPEEALRKIMFYVAPTGAQNFVNAGVSSKELQLVSEDVDTLRRVNFDNFSISHCPIEHFQQEKGLVNRCVQVGNKKAVLVLAKIILLSSTQMLIAKAVRASLGSNADSLPSIRAIKEEIIEQSILVSSFLEYFTPEPFTMVSSMEEFLAARPRPAPLTPKSKPAHYRLVRIFLKEATFNDMKEMDPHFKHYIYHFLQGKQSDSSKKFLEWLDQLRYFRMSTERNLEEVGDTATPEFLQTHNAKVDLIFQMIKEELVAQFDCAFRIVMGHSLLI